MAAALGRSRGPQARYLGAGEDAVCLTPKLYCRESYDDAQVGNSPVTVSAHCSAVSAHRGVAEDVEAASIKRGVNAGRSSIEIITSVTCAGSFAAGRRATLRVLSCEGCDRTALRETIRNWFCSLRTLQTLHKGPPWESSVLPFERSHHPFKLTARHAAPLSSPPRPGLQGECKCITK